LFCFTDIEKHQEAIHKVKCEEKDETSLKAVLAQHLFSQLVPGHNNIVDDRSEKLPKECPCAGNEPILKGCTSLGTSI